MEETGNPAEKGSGEKMTILIVDDEDRIRALITKYAAADLDEALEMLIQEAAGSVPEGIYYYSGGSR